MAQGYKERVLIGYFMARGLTKREAEVMDLLLTGVSNKEIADKLFVAEKTVKTHAWQIYKKMNVKTRYELMFKFTRMIPVEELLLQLKQD